MTIPLQITYRNMDSSTTIQALAEQKLETIERVSARIQRCHLTVEAQPHPEKSSANRFQVTLTASLPGVPEIVTHGGAQDTDCAVAVHHAFDALRREVVEQARVWHERSAERPFTV